MIKKKTVEISTVIIWDAKSTKISKAQDFALSYRWPYFDPICDISTDDITMLLPLPPLRVQRKLTYGGRRCLKYQNNPLHTLPIKPLHSEKCAIFSEVQVSKKAELLMFLIFLACLTYFWLWLETARPPVCEIQSCDTAVIWVTELGFVCNWRNCVSV